MTNIHQLFIHNRRNASLCKKACFGSSIVHTSFNWCKTFLPDVGFRCYLTFRNVHLRGRRHRQIAFDGVGDVRHCEVSSACHCVWPLVLTSTAKMHAASSIDFLITTPSVRFKHDHTASQRSWSYVTTNAALKCTSAGDCVVDDVVITRTTVSQTEEWTLRNLTRHFAVDIIITELHQTDVPQSTQVLKWCWFI